MGVKPPSPVLDAYGWNRVGFRLAAVPMITANTGQSAFGPIPVNTNAALARHIWQNSPFAICETGKDQQTYLNANIDSFFEIRSSVRLIKKTINPELRDACAVWKTNDVHYGSCDIFRAG